MLMTRSDTEPKTRNKNNALEKYKPGLPRELMKMEFFLEAHSAKSVRLAADFTDWEKFSIEMTMAKNGIWSVAVPLSPGHYSYRFIVDDEWCDDPHCTNRIPNSFGTTNGVIRVI